MNRVRDYVQFAVWFIGLGYIVLWPLTAHDNDIAALGATLICGDALLGPVNLLCNPPRALHLSPGLHLIGLLSAVCVVVRVLLRQLRRSPRADGEADPTAAAAASRIPAVPSRPAPQKPWCPPRPVKPRKNFGLRGVPH
jgi:hypothetical protein